MTTVRREVRCCCDVGKLLGTMEVDKDIKGEFFTENGLKLEVAPWTSKSAILHYINLLRGDAYKDVAIADIMREVKGVTRVAIKSNDYPMEDLMKIPTFVPVRE